MSKKLVFISFVVSLGGFLFGFDAGIIFGAIAFVGFFIMLKILPETKGKFLEALEKEFVKA